MMRLLTVIICLAFSSLILPSGIWAQMPPSKTLAVRQNIGQPLDLKSSFRDESRRSVVVNQFFGHRPVLLMFVYFHCPMLCPLNMKGLARSLAMTGQTPGRDYELLIVSFDPHDKPEESAKSKAVFVRLLGEKDAASGIHFLTGDEENIRALTASAGFPYTKDENTGQYGHAAVLLAVTPEGTINRYLFGLDYAPRDIRLALSDARDDKKGSLTDAVLMFCFAYDPSNGRYTLAILNLLKLAAALTVIVLAGLLYLLKRQEVRA